jgi:hypothetical protein
MGKHITRVNGAKYRNAPDWVIQQIIDRREIAPEGCWLWPGYINRDGYGVIMYTAHREDGTAHRPQLFVHRLSYMHFVADLDDDQQIDHTCHDPAVCLARKKDCPHRHCYNPEHLEPVAGVVNLMRSGNFTPLNAAKTHCVRGHRFEGRNLRFAPDGGRVCRECRQWHSVSARTAAAAQFAPWTGEPRCRACGADISHRPPQARFCELCTPVKRTQNAARLRLAREAESAADLVLFDLTEAATGTSGRHQ